MIPRTPLLPDGDRQIWERIAELARTLPADVIAGLPTDGASQVDHYIYGTKKREVMEWLQTRG